MSREENVIKLLAKLKSYIIRIPSSDTINKIQIKPGHDHSGFHLILTEDDINKCLDRAFDYIIK